MLSGEYGWPEEVAERALDGEENGCVWIGIVPVSN